MGLVSGAAIGATVALAPAAQAADFPVNQITDTGDGMCDATCTLRDAVDDANTNAAGSPDTISFTGAVNAPIRLTGGQLSLSGGQPVTISGGGTVTISGDANADGMPNSGDSRIFYLPSATSKATLTGLTLTGGYTNLSDGGGAIRVAKGATLEIADSILTGNTALNGGAISASMGSKYTPPPDTPVVKITNSKLTDNTGTTGSGGAIRASGTELTVTNTEITGNDSGGGGGGISAVSASSLDLRDSTVSGNTATQSGGGVVVGGSGTYSGVIPKSSITRSTISGNESSNLGGGLALNSLPDNESVTVSETTISGNKTVASGSGGGLGISASNAGDVKVANSTITGNTAPTGGGATIGAGASPLTSGDGTVVLSNLTIASNEATTDGGGIFQPSYSDGAGGFKIATVPLASTIVADNTAAGAANDLGRTANATAGGIAASFSLIETPGTVTVTPAPGSPAPLATDPALSPLAANGGLTQTMLPGDRSPALDAGIANGSTVDQRGLARTVDLDPANAAGGDGTDIGAVELAALTKPETTIDSGPSGPTKSKKPTFTFSSSEPGSTFECQLDGGAFETCTSPKVYEGLKDGAHTFTVRAVDPDGFADPTPATLQFKLDTKRPKTTITKAPKKSVTTKKRKKKVKVAFESERGSTFECSVDGAKFKRCKSPLKVKVKSGPGDGKDHTIEVQAIDKAGNVEKEPVAVKFTVVREAAKKPKG